VRAHVLTTYHEFDVLIGGPDELGDVRAVILRDGVHEAHAWGVRWWHPSEIVDVVPPACPYCGERAHVVGSSDTWRCTSCTGTFR
jgi:hypothetical protein